MNDPRKLHLPDEYYSLGPHPVRYRVVRRTEKDITVSREGGQIVRIPVDLLLRCCDSIKDAPDQALPMQQIIKDLAENIRYGESIIAATLVASGLAEVVCKRPVTLKAV